MSITYCAFTLSSLALVSSFCAIILPDGNFKKPCEKVAALAVAVTAVLLTVSFFKGEKLSVSTSKNIDIEENSALNVFLEEYSLERKKLFVKNTLESDGLTVLRADFFIENGAIEKIEIYIDEAVINGFYGNINISEEERKIASSLSVKKEAVTIFGNGEGKKES